jgi:hypothetical protein
VGSTSENREEATMGSVTTMDTCVEAPPIRYEACSDYEDAATADGCCAGCGWPLDDHDLPTAA